ncbi:MAG TPA: adenylate/guanylate cyclase domain-containing protein [Dongiaceae bacterium]
MPGPKVILCPACRGENAPGRRFCAACGKPLPVACLHCGFANGPNDRFCGGCGLELTPAPAGASPTPPVSTGELPIGEIRPVAVMFVDICGYTALSGRLDPEDTHRLLTQFFEAVDEIAVRFGGRIDKHIGDSVMALFGAPIAHGNDEERAVLAASAIHQAMPALSARTGQVLSVHIGIASGEVVASGLGSISHSAYTVIGDSVNLAARLMERAGSGDTLISGTVRQGASRNAVTEPLGALAFKGIAGPVETFRVSPMAQAAPGEASQAPMRGSSERALVGRRAELAQLSALIDTALTDGRGAAIVLRGEPGIGKTRLADAFHDQAKQRGFCALRALVLDFGGMRESGMERVLAKGLLARIAGGGEPESPLEASQLEAADRPYLRDLLDAPQPEAARATYEAMSHAARNRGKSAVLAKLATKAAEAGSVFILVEDVHWSDAAVLGHLAALAEVTGGTQLVLALTTRIEGDPFDDAFRAGLRQGRLTAIDLGPLRTEEAVLLAQALRQEMDDFARRCIARAGGNPLFLEQLLREGGGGEKLPQSLQSVVLARLDQLGAQDRQALQAAAILGQRSERNDLAALIQRPDYDPAELLRRQLLRPEADGLLFAHALIRDGAYSSLTRERRFALHRAAAKLFLDRDPALHAEHLDRAEDAGAPRAYIAAAEYEAVAYHADRALRLAERGLAIAVRPEDRVALGLAAGRLGMDIGLAKPARSAFAIATESTDARDRCSGLIGLAAADRMLAEIPQAFASLAEAEPIATSLGEPALLAEICYQRGNLNFAMGRAEDCLSEHRRALAAAKRAGVPEWMARARSGLGDAYYMEGRLVSCGRQFLRAVEIAHDARLLRIMPANQCMAAHALLYSMRLDEALSMAEESRRLALELGDRFGEMFALECRAYILMMSGRQDGLAEITELALERSRALGARRYEAILLSILGMERHRAGRGAEGVVHARDGFRIAKETGSGFCGALICGVLCIVETDRDRRQAAIAEGRALLRETGLSHNHIWFRVYAIDWALRERDWTEAERFAGDLAQYTAREPLPTVDLMIARGRTLARLGRNPADEAALHEFEQLRAKAATAGMNIDPMESAVP